MLIDQIRKSLVRTNNLVDYLETALACDLFQPDMRKSRATDALNLVDAFINRVTPILDRKYHCPMAFVPPSNMTELRTFMYKTGLFNTHSNIRDNIINIRAGKGQAARWYGNSTIHSVSEYIRFEHITQEQLETLRSHVELAGDQKLLRMFNAPVMYGVDFNETVMPFDTSKIRVISEFNFLLSGEINFEDVMAEVDSYISTVFTKLNTEDDISVTDCNNILNILHAMKNIFMRKYENGIVQRDYSMKQLVMMHKNADKVLNVIELLLM